MNEPQSELSTTLPTWLIERVKELAEQTGLTKDEIILNALSSQIFPKQEAKKVLKMVAALVLLCTTNPAFAQTEATDPPLNLKLKPPIASTTPTPEILTAPVATLSVGSNQQILKQTSDGTLIGAPAPTTSDGGGTGGGTMLLKTPAAPAAAPAPGNFKKNLRRCRFLCNFFAPFVNMAAAIKNFFN